MIVPGDVMSDKIQRFPLKETKRIKNLRGPMAVPCQVTERWLDFDAESVLLRCGEVIGLRVMTMGVNGKPRKLCFMYVTREDLLGVLQKVEPKEDD
jgi:hypothetical protein